MVAVADPVAVAASVGRMARGRRSQRRQMLAVSTTRLQLHTDRIAGDEKTMAFGHEHFGQMFYNGADARRIH